MCPEGKRLRLAWYAASVDLSQEWRDEDPTRFDLMEANRQERPYQRAYNYLRAHMTVCDECRAAVWGVPVVAVEAVSA